MPQICRKRHLFFKVFCWAALLSRLSGWQVSMVSVAQWSQFSISIKIVVDCWDLWKEYEFIWRMNYQSDFFKKEIISNHKRGENGEQFLHVLQVSLAQPVRSNTLAKSRPQAHSIFRTTLKNHQNQPNIWSSESFSCFPSRIVVMTKQSIFPKVKCCLEN